MSDTVLKYNIPSYDLFMSYDEDTIMEIFSNTNANFDRDPVKCTNIIKDIIEVLYESYGNINNNFYTEMEIFLHKINKKGYSQEYKNEINTLNTLNKCINEKILEGTCRLIKHRLDEIDIGVFYKCNPIGRFFSLFFIYSDKEYRKDMTSYLFKYDEKKTSAYFHLCILNGIAHCLKITGNSIDDKLFNKTKIHHLPGNVLMCFGFANTENREKIIMQISNLTTYKTIENYCIENNIFN